MAEPIILNRVVLPEDANLQAERDCWRNAARELVAQHRQIEMDRTGEIAAEMKQLTDRLTR